MMVKEILVNVTGITYDYSNSDFPSIVPNELTHIGQLQFSPKPVCGEECYLDFPDRWAPSVISSNCKNHYPDLMHTKLEAFRGMRSSFSSISFRVQTNHVRRYDFNGSASIIWPKLVTNGGPIEFPTYQVGEEVLKVIEVTNPTDQPIKLYYMLHDVARHGSAMTYPPEVMTLCWDCFLSRENVFSLVGMDDLKYSRLQHIPPRSTSKLTIRFFTQNAGSYSNLLYIRNNFTILEALWLTAKAAAHQFKFGNRRPGSDTPLMFELSDKHFRECKRSAEHLDAPPVMVTAKRTFTAKNTGDVPIEVYGMYIEGLRCEGYGFRILNCWKFRLPPDSSKKIEIVFTPDFTLARIDHILSIETSLHYAINYTLSSLVPSAALNSCGKALRRPPWEYQLRCIAFIVLSITLFLVALAAFFESDKLLKDHVHNMSRDKSPMEPTLDLRQIGMRSPLFEDLKATPPPAIMPSIGSTGTKSHSKPFSYLRKRGTVKRVEIEQTTISPKSWANVLVQKFSPIKSDVKFRDKTPPPPNQRYTDNKKDSAHKRLFKEVVALMDAQNRKPGDDDSSSTTTDCSSLSTEILSMKSPNATRKKTTGTANVQIASPISGAPPSPPSMATTDSAQKSKAKTVVKKTKSLPAQPIFKETTPDPLPSLVKSNPVAQPIKPVKGVVSLPKVSNGKVDNRQVNRKDNELQTKRLFDPTNSLTPLLAEDGKEQSNQTNPCCITDDANNSTNQRKYGKTPGRERRKEAPIIPVTRKQNLSKITDKPYKGTAFSFSSPLTCTTSQAATSDNIITQNTSDAPSNVWDFNKISFSNIVAQIPTSDASCGNNVALNPFGDVIKATAPEVSSTSPQKSLDAPTIPANNSSGMQFSIPSTKFSRLTGKVLFEDYTKLKEVRDFAGRSCDHFMQNNEQALELLEVSCEEILPSHLTNGVDLGPIGTRKSPSNTPVWEPLPSIQKPIATAPNASGNPNSFFSENFPQYANSFVNNSDAGPSTMHNEANNMNLAGVAGLLDNVYGQDVTDKQRVWDQSLWFSLMQQAQVNQHQQQNIPLNSTYTNHPQNSYRTNFGLSNPINPPLHAQSSRPSPLFSDSNTLWGSSYATAPVPTAMWNSNIGPTRPPPGLERQSIPNRLYNQQQQGLEQDQNQNNFNHSSQNNGHSSFDTFNSLSSIWSADSWNNSTASSANHHSNNNNHHANSSGSSTERNNPQL